MIYKINLITNENIKYLMNIYFIFKINDMGIV